MPLDDEKKRRLRKGRKLLYIYGCNRHVKYLLSQLKYILQLSTIALKCGWLAHTVMLA